MHQVFHPTVTNQDPRFLIEDADAMLANVHIAEVPNVFAKYTTFLETKPFPPYTHIVPLLQSSGLIRGLPFSNSVLMISLISRLLRAFS